MSGTSTHKEIVPVTDWPLIRRFGRQSHFCAALTLFLVSEPLLTSVFDQPARWSVYVALIFVYVTGPLAVARTQLMLRITAVLAALTLVMGVSAQFAESGTLGMSSNLLGIAFFTFIIVLETRHLLFERPVVDTETLWAAVNIYIVMGILFAFVFSSLELLDPGSFKSAASHLAPENRVYGYLYFSFVTLTTLGYGDVTPVTIAAGTLAYLEALIGQLYLAILIARLVGIYASSGGESSTNALDARQSASASTEPERSDRPDA